MAQSTVVRAAGAIAAVGAVGLGLLAVPAGAGQAPSLPDVAAEELVSSVLTAGAPALSGTVQVDNALGLPALPGLAERHAEQAPLARPVTTARVWSDGQGRSRLALPSRSGGQTFVADGDTLWRYDSASRTATAVEYGGRPPSGRVPDLDPATAARALVGEIRETSTVTVDGTARVAGRPAYELVLSPAPTERTLLREVRLAVDAATRLPLRLTVLANGSPEPALQAGFTELEIAPQDGGLFTFTPPEGVAVQRPELPRRHQPSSPEPLLRALGDGWDTVVMGRLPASGTGERDVLALARGLGRPTSGPWGDGWAIDTAVATVLVTSDGRVAGGAVPRQVLDEALAR